MANYGTVGRQDQNRNHNVANDAVDEERAALLASSKPSGSSLGSRLHRHWNEKVSSTWGDIALLFCYIITGLLDSSSVYTWGSFVSMQTGNTVYLGAGVVAPTEGDRWLRALISLVSFCVGSFFFARYHRYFGGKKRWVIVSSYILQLIMILVSAVMVSVGPRETPQDPITIWVVIPIALVAFQASGQAVISRVLKYGSLTSVVLTSIYCDLFSDEKFFAGLTQNVERNRRAAAPVLLLIGAIFGGLWAHSSVGLAGALWTAVVLKVAVIAAWCLWAAEKDEEPTA